MTIMPDVSAEPHDPDRWKKDSTRQLILAAARRLSAREGIEAVTLGRVAAEAGFAAPAVYTYFVTKDDLHLALVADDLETIAEVMRDDISVSAGAQVVATEDEDTARTGARVDLGENALLEPGQADSPSSVSLADLEQALGVVREPEDEFGSGQGLETEAIPDAFPEDAVVEPGALSAPESMPRRRGRAHDDQLSMPLDPSAAADPAPGEDAPASPHLAEPGDVVAAIAQLQDAVLRLEQRPVDSWLERRLRVFERTLSDLESRMERVEQDSAGAMAKVDESNSLLTNQMAEALGTSHRDLIERNEHQAAAVADLRAYVKDVAGRLSAVEGWLSRKWGAAAQEARDAAAAQDGGASDLQQLASARRSARPAGEEPASPGRATARGGKGLSRLSARTLWLVTAVLVVALAATGADLAWQRPAAPKAAPAVAALAPAANSVDGRVVALAKAGNAKAELVAGLKLLNGDGTATDIPSAAYWLRKAALQNQPVAQYWLGTLYERGRGLPKDPALALQWYAKAAAAGNAKAMYRMGVGYAEGWTGKPDDAAAAKWFAAAAKFGVVDAQFNLAVLYERGSGVPMSLTNAFTWYAIAAAQGDAGSKARLDELAAHMNSGDVSAAQAAAQKFQPLTPPAAGNDAPDPAELAAHP